VHSSSGPIAATRGLTYAPAQWTMRATFPIAQNPESPSETPNLSWGADGELLVGTSQMSLYSTGASPTCLWRKTLASPSRCATISYDSAYIASAGGHDRLVKVWRRLTYGPEDVRFDFAYLSHPDVVISLQWRKPYHIDHTTEIVLYTFCADNNLRVWTRSDAHGSQHLQLWGKVDLMACMVNAALPDATPRAPLAFIIQGRDLSAATEQALQEDSGKEKDGAALQHLINIANRSSEICVVLDGQGRMSAVSMENVGPRAQTTNDVFSIAQLSSPDLDFGYGHASAPAPHVEVYNYCNKGSGHLYILTHLFRGEIEVYETNIARLFDENCTARRLWHKSTWSGHSAPVKKMVRNASGHALVSRTAEGETVVWNHALVSGRLSLGPKNMMPDAGHIHRICVLESGQFVIFLFHDRVVMWDCRTQAPTLLAECAYALPGKPLCLLSLPAHGAERTAIAHVATITSEKHGIVWEVVCPSAAAGPTLNGHTQPSIQEMCRFSLEDAGDLAYVLPVDPAGSTVIASGFLDVFAPDVAISYTHSGRVEFWTARISRDTQQVEWLSTSSMETGVVEPSLVSGSTMKKAALVNSDRSAVTIWDIRGARLEYARQFESQNSVQDLDWTSTPDSQSILAVGFPFHVLLLSQMRFDYLNKGPAWAPIREISIRECTPHPIGDSAWLGDGHLVIGAGNQLFVHDRSFDVSSSLVTSLRLPHRRDGMWDLFEVVQRLNGPLPVFHPQFLSQCMLAGKMVLVQRILVSLYKTLKFWIPGETLDDYLGMALEDFYADEAVSGTDRTTL